MKSNECKHEVPFRTFLLVTNPLNYPCPHCQKRLTLNKTGRRCLAASLSAAALYAGIVGTMSTLYALQGMSLVQLATFNLIGLSSMILLLIAFGYVAWKRSAFVERTMLEQVRRTKKPKPGLRQLLTGRRLAYGISEG